MWKGTVVMKVEKRKECGRTKRGPMIDKDVLSSMLVPEERELLEILEFSEFILKYGNLLKLGNI